MASSSPSSKFHLPISAIPFLLLLLAAHPSSACYTHLFSFGDSLTDTGNFAHSLGNTPDHVLRLPYGSTYFGRPTGRFSDGRLIVDFLAEAFGLPFGTPYLAGKSAKDFQHGANFAVGGATALSSDFFKEKGMVVTWTEYSLGTQIQWFKRVLSLLSNESDCSNIMSSSLFVVGEIGGNDYNHQFLQGRDLATVRSFVPSVVHVISSAINELIELGAKTLVVPGNFPIGCVPVYLTIFRSQREEDYDPKTGCIKWLNEFSEHHNQVLQDELDRLRGLHPRVTIIYADYFGASMNIFRSPHQFGFLAPLNACCGSDGPYNCTPSIICGSPESRVCAHPSTYASWDGLHLTEAAYKLVAHGVLRGPYAVPALAKTCPHIELNAAPLLYSNQCSG